MESNGAAVLTPEADRMLELVAPAQGYRAYYEEQARGLREAAQKAEAEADEARLIYEAMVTDAKKLRRAADILAGEAVNATPARRGSRRGGKAAAKGNGWSLSEAKVQDVWNIIRELDAETFTASS